MPKEIKQSVLILLFFTFLGSVAFLFSYLQTSPRALFSFAPQDQTAAVTFSGKEYYVTETGTASGNGSLSRPWDLATALLQPSGVGPGDIIWVKKGTYRGTFYSRLKGNASSPIVVRAYPGERVTIDGGDSKGKGIFVVDGAYTWYWGLEIMSSAPKRVTSTSGSWPNGTEIPRGDGIQLIQQTDSGVGVKFINNVIHDTRQGMSFWYQAVGAEIYGSLIYYNGWDAPDRAHGHGIYTQNITGTKLIEDNIIFKQFSDGIQAYGTSDAFIYNYMLRGNTIFDNGLIAGENGGGSNLQVGGGNPVKNFTITNNYFYRSKGAGTVNVGQADNNEDVYVTNNYIDSLIRFNGWKRLTFTDNTIVGNNVLLDLRPVTTLSNIKNLGYNWTNNKYFSVEGQYKPFLIVATDTGTRLFDYSQWRITTNLDGSSTYTPGKPTGLNIFVRPNKYETGRANITIYNWGKSGSVSVSLAGTGLKVGDKFEIRDAQNFFGAPVVTGTWNGGNVSIPMSGLSPAPTVGTVTTPPTHTAPEFGVFVLIPPGSTGMGSYSGNPDFPAGGGALPGQTSSGTQGSNPLAAPGNWFASPTGSASGTGKIDSPWDLTTALNKTSTILPGHTLWLRGGTYNGIYTSNLKGVQNQFITVRQYPGERTILDGRGREGSILSVSQPWVQFWGFEITNSDPSRPVNSDIFRTTGVRVGAPDVKLINLTIHDAGVGIASQYPDGGTDFETYGNIIFFNGNDNNREHGIYDQNATGVKKLIDNIVYANGNTGIQNYGSSAVGLNNFQVIGNIIYDSGVIGTRGGKNLLIGGGSIAKNNIVQDNLFYYTKPAGALLDLGQYGYGAGTLNTQLTNNYIVASSRTNPVRFSSVQTNLSMSGNTIYGTVEGLNTASYPNNSYLTSKPTQNKIVVRPNKYDLGRANIAIYNWQLSPSVSVDISNIGLNVGDSYEIRSIQNYFGDVKTVVYDGKPITISMTGRTVGSPVGAPNGVSTPPSTFPEFGAFLISKPSSGGALPPSMPGTYTPPSYPQTPTTPTTPPTSGPDTMVPTVSISQSPPTAPRGTITLGAFAKDNVAIKNVQFIIDGTVVGTITTPVSASAPNIYYYQWDTTSVPLGEHTLTIRATDTTNHTATSESAIITVVAGSTNGGNDSVAPSVAITSPSANARVSGSVYVAAYASDNIGVVRVQFLVDGVVVGILPLSNLYAGAALAQSARSYYSFVWDTLTVPVGTHTLSAQATDGAGNVTLSSPITVTVERPIAVGNGGNTQSGGQTGGGAAPQSLPPPGYNSGSGMLPGTSQPIVIPNPLKAKSITCFLKDVLDIILVLGSILIVLVLIFAGLLFIAAQGNPAKIKTAKSAFFTAIIGAALILGAWALGQLIANTLRQIGTVPSEIVEEC